MTDSAAASIRDVVDLDLEELDFRSGLTGLVVLAIVLVLVGIFGPAGMAAGIAALFVLAGASGETGRSFPEHCVFVVVGALVTLAVGYSAGSVVAASLAIAFVAFGAAMVALRGPVATADGAYLLIWAVLTLSIEDSPASAPAMAGAFVVGGVIAVVAIWAVSLLESPSTSPEVVQGASPSLDVGLVMFFSVIRAVGAGGCVALGSWWFPDHAAWAAFAFVLVLRPPKEQALITGLGRTLGTVLGVFVGMALAGLVGDSTLGLVIAFGFCGFAMLATSNVNYALSTMFTTALLLIAQKVIQEDVVATGWDRMGATVVGVAVAFLAIGVINLASPRSAHEGAEA
ncbi:MAG: FUSC family protein [Microthrixaceae bacterium]